MRKLSKIKPLAAQAMHAAVLVDALRPKHNPTPKLRQEVLKTLLQWCPRYKVALVQHVETILKVQATDHDVLHRATEITFTLAPTLTSNLYPSTLALTLALALTHTLTLTLSPLTLHSSHITLTLTLTPTSCPRPHPHPHPHPHPNPHLSPFTPHASPSPRYRISRGSFWRSLALTVRLQRSK